MIFGRALRSKRFAIEIAFLSVCLSVCLLVCLSVRQSVRPSVCLDL